MAQLPEIQHQEVQALGKDLVAGLKKLGEDWEHMTPAEKTALVVTGVAAVAYELLPKEQKEALRQRAEALVGDATQTIERVVPAPLRDFAKGLLRRPAGQ